MNCGCMSSACSACGNGTKAFLKILGAAERADKDRPRRTQGGQRALQLLQLELDVRRQPSPVVVDVLLLKSQAVAEEPGHLAALRDAQPGVPPPGRAAFDPRRPRQPHSSDAFLACLVHHHQGVLSLHRGLQTEAPLLEPPAAEGLLLLVQILLREL